MSIIRKKEHLKNLEPWQDPSVKPYVLIENVNKNFGAAVAVKNLSLSIYRGELFALLGASGCGKSTLLRILAGLEKPSSGRIVVDDLDITDLPPYKRPVSMMFQSYALFPHMTVEENISFGLKQEKLSKAQINERVDEVLDLVQLRKYKDRKPNRLSGGQQQRVAIARALAPKPALILADEPTANLDTENGKQVMEIMKRLNKETGETFVFATHDPRVINYATRVVTLEDGLIVKDSAGSK